MVEPDKVSASRDGPLDRSELSLYYPRWTVLNLSLIWSKPAEMEKIGKMAEIAAAKGYDTPEGD